MRSLRPLWRMNIDISADLARVLPKRMPEGARACALSLGLLLLIASGCGLSGGSDRDGILILARRGDATSRAIAETLAEHYHVPDERILELSLTTAPNAREMDAETYQREIAGPITRHLTLEEAHDEVWLLVTTLGLPLMIRGCEVVPVELPSPSDPAELAESPGPSAPSSGTAAIVPPRPAAPASLSDCRLRPLDGSLSKLGGAPTNSSSSSSLSSTSAPTPIANPFFGSLERFSEFREDHPDSPLRFLVARLTATPDSKSERGRTPQAIISLLERPDAVPPETEDALAKPHWFVAGAAPAKRTTATALLLAPIEAQLPLAGHRVCSRCDAKTREPEMAGIVFPTKAALKGEGNPSRVGQPGVVFALAAPSTTKSKGRPSALESFVDLWLARGATAISLTLEDAELARVARPALALSAWAHGASAIEAHFSSLPTLGGQHLFVGDPLRRLPDFQLPEDELVDRDQDGIGDTADNCWLESNADQRDTNNDGFGNRCDADVDDDGLVDRSNGQIYPVDQRGDLEAITLSARSGFYDPNHDLDGDGEVNERDLLIARLALNRAPGN